MTSLNQPENQRIPPNMKSKPLPGLLALLFALAPLARSQENTLALGRVSSAGDLQGSVNPIGATISATRPSPGRYEITVAAPGAFTGEGVGDFLVQAMVRTVGLTDRACATAVTSVDPDALVATVFVSDMEDNTDLDAPEPSNLSFQFAIHRLRPGGSISPSSRYLYATGSVTNNGALKLGVSADGAVVSSSQNGVGDYRVRFEKSGAFSGGLDNYVIVASSGSSTSFSDNILSGAPSSTNQDHVEFTIRSADVQNASNVNPEAEDEEFHFLVYRTTDPESVATPASRLLLGMASVQGDNGILRRGATSIPGTFLTSTRSGIGRYSLVLNAPGRFAGKSIDDFIILAGINSPDFSDRSIIAEPFLIGPDSLTITIRTNDLEVNGQLLAVAADSDFYLTIHDAVATSQPDLRIGKKPTLSTMKGNNLYNSTALGQKILTAPSSSGLARIHLATENDGNVTQDLMTRGKRGPGLSKTRCFQLTGGKKNVTAAFLAASTTAPAVRPGDAVRYEIRTTLPNNSAKSRSVLRFQTGTSPLDRAAAQIVRNP
jgi:hypothetical protein